ncbi:hypothetical protein ACWIVX_23150, partial [Enterobacter asburiae]
QGKVSALLLIVLAPRGARTTAHRRDGTPAPSGKEITAGITKLKQYLRLFTRADKKPFICGLSAKISQ